MNPIVKFGTIQGALTIKLKQLSQATFDDLKAHSTDNDGYYSYHSIIEFKNGVKWQLEWLGNAYKLFQFKINGEWKGDYKLAFNDFILKVESENAFNLETNGGMISFSGNQAR